VALEETFAAVQALELAQFGDGPHDATPLSLSGDVLGLSNTRIHVSGSGLVISGPPICVRHRPEWLGLDIGNQSSLPAKALLVLERPGEQSLVAHLPIVGSGETRRILLKASVAIATLPATSLRFVPAE
jgi:hypothetical protein